jgi:hypothetical protein
VLIVLASQADAAAAKVVSAWHGQNAALLSGESLSQRGWVWQPESIDDSSLVIDGCPLPVRAVRGVVSLMPAIDPRDLHHIVADEREYVAGEMTAFLVAWLTWLSGLGVPVMNRPTPLSLTGPALHHEQWLQAAGRVGLPIRPAHRRVPPSKRPSTEESWRRWNAVPPDDRESSLPIPVVRGHTLPGPEGQQVPDAVCGALGRLAAAVGAELMTALLVDSDGRFLFRAAVPSVDVSREDVATEILNTFGAAE